VASYEQDVINDDPNTQKTVIHRMIIISGDGYSSIEFT
jgi:hypothetical protein